MHGDKVKSRHLEGLIEVENVSDQLLDNCVVSLRSIFSGNLIFEKTILQPGEIKRFPILGPSTFRNHWGDEALSLKVYSNHDLVHRKLFKDKTKCFVVISNDKFEKIAEQLIIGLTRYSNVDILHYTIGYKSSLDYRYLQNIEFDLKGDLNDPQYMQFVKPPVFLDVLDRGYKAAVFIDADVQVRSNVEDLFGYINQIEDGPVFHKSPHEFTVIHNMYIPGPLLSGLMDLNVEKQLAPQGITNAVIFNQTHRDLFEEWNTLCFSNEIEEIRKTEFLHDELLINCLMWKKGIKPKLFFLTMNVNTIKDVEFFYHHTKEYSPQTDLNNYNLGFFAQTFINYESETICGFHCVKDPEVAKEINRLVYKNEIGVDFNEEIIDFYENLEIANNRFFEEKKPLVINHYVSGPYLEIKGNSDKDYKIQFIDGKSSIAYESSIKANMWTRCSRRYYDDYTTRIFENSELVYDEKINLEGKKVYISLESSSLGDTLAWFPYAEEFRKKHNCHVVVSTFMNALFKDQYPDLEFVAPGTNVQGIYAMYNIGWFYDDNSQPDLSRNKVDFRSIPLQQTATEILGLEYKEVKPLINVPQVEKKKKVGLGIHSTAQAKYWNNPTGWQEVTDYLIQNGYEVVIYSKEGDGYMGNNFPKGATKFPNGPLESVIEDMASCEFFIGIGSGLSWLAWTVGLPMILISGFSEEYSEPTENVTRIINKDVCHGCFNKHRLDAGDWNWCPLHKGTERQFECTKTITGGEVIKAIRNNFNTPKVAFITAIYGNYEATCKRYIPQNIPTDFICFTDNENTPSNGWIIDTHPYHDTNPSDLDKPEMVNSLKNNRHTFNIAKYYKQAWKNIPRLKEYDVVIWIDGTIEVTNPDASKIMYEKVKQYGVVGWNHELRFGKLEPEVLASIGVDANGGRYTSTYYMGQNQPFQDVSAQYSKYLEDGYNEEYWSKVERIEGKGNSQHFGVWLTCFIGFDTSSIEVSKFMDNWYTQTLKFTTQDQIGFPKTVQETGLIPYTYPDEQVAGHNPHVYTDFYYRHHHGL